MKSIKKITAFVLALTMVFSMLIVAHAEGERIISEPCPYCGEAVYTSTTYQFTGKTVKYPCIHDKDGTDTYGVYNVIETHTCSSSTCSYKTTYNAGTVERLKSCNGT